MQSGFGQFCPVALACETLTQKWALLVVRELCAGATRFSEIRRGVPRMSATLLKQRLEALERAGIVERCGQGYGLTEAGEELRPVLASLGAWGQRWARDIEKRDLDPGWLVWSMHRRLDLASMPPGRTVIEIDFADARASQRRFWLVCERGEVDVCLKHPGYDPDIVLGASVRVLAEVWRGLRSLGAEMKAGRLRLEGDPALKRAFPRWLMLSAYAGIERKRR